VVVPVHREDSVAFVREVFLEASCLYYSCHVVSNHIKTATVLIQNYCLEGVRSDGMLVTKVSSIKLLTYFPS
jgi:hypothetical protein